MILTFVVDGRDVKIESTEVVGLRPDGASMTTLMMDDESMIHVTAPFISVRVKLKAADKGYW